MQTQARYVQVLGLILGLALLVGLSPAQAGDPDAAVKKTFDKLIGAIKAADRDAFVANATDDVKKGVSQEVMDDLKKGVGARLDKGYKASYLCQLKQAGHQVHLWKLTFKDDGDDIIVRLALKDGKMGGFFLQ